MLGDDIAAALPELRAHAESRMRETVTVKSVLSVVPDPTTGVDVVTYGATPVYEGKCRIKSATSQSVDADAGGSLVTQTSPELHIPSSGPALLPGHVAFMASDTESPRLRGLVYRVDSAHAASDTTAQRVPVTNLPGVA